MPAIRYHTLCDFDIQDDNFLYIEKGRHPLGCPPLDLHILPYFVYHLILLIIA